MDQIIQHAEDLLNLIIEKSKTLKKDEFVSFDGVNFGVVVVKGKEQSYTYIYRTPIKGPPLEGLYGNDRYKKTAIEKIIYKKLSIKTSDEAQIPDYWKETNESFELAVFYYQQREEE